MTILFLTLCGLYAACLYPASAQATRYGFLSPGTVISDDTVTVSVAPYFGDDTLDVVWFRVQFHRDATGSAPTTVTDTLIGLDSIAPFSVVWDCRDIADQDEESLLFYCEALTRHGLVVGGPESFSHRAALVRGTAAKAAPRMYASYHRRALVCDGDMGEWPAIRKTKFGPRDTPVRMRAFWNEGYLCLGIEVTAAQADLQTHAAGMFSHDGRACATGIVVFFDILNDRDATRRNDDIAVALSPSATRAVLRAPSGDTAAPLFGTLPTAEGYTMEIAFPCDWLGLSAYRNARIGFNVAVFTCDTVRQQLLFHDWAANTRLSSSLPGNWGVLVLRKSRPWWHFALAAVSLLLCVLAAWHIISRLRGTRRMLRDPDSYSLTLRYAIGLLDENCREKELDLRDLAETLYLTGPRLARMIRRETGMNVADFIGAVRLLKARRLLVETLMTESDIAESVGMSDIQAFSTAFSAATGLTPAAFRDWHGVANRIGTTLADESIRAAASPQNPAGAPDESNDTGQR